MRSIAVRTLVTTLAAVSLVLAAAPIADAQPALRSLHSFTYSGPTVGADGSEPQGGLVLGRDGYLYGMTRAGGTYATDTWEGGTLFRVRPDGTGYEKLHSFSYDRPSGGLPDPLVQDAQGYFYGTINGTTVGTLFRLDMSSGSASVTDLKGIHWPGHYVHEGVLLASDGRLYVTLLDEATRQTSGAIWSTTPDSTSGWQVVYEFAGEAPTAGLIEGLDGRLYGATDSASGGRIFAVDKFASSPSTLRTGLGEVSTLTQGPDGTLYGAAVRAGVSGAGSIFRIQPNGGNFASLHEFAPTDPGGHAPRGSVLLGKDGYLYGTASQGPSTSSSPAGSVFRLATDGSTFENLHVFSLTDGASPAGALAQLGDHGIYGVTSQGGNTADAASMSWGKGTVFGLDLLRVDLATDPFVYPSVLTSFRLKLQNISGVELPGPFTVQLSSSPGLLFGGDSVDAWSCTGPSDGRLCTWQASLSAGQETPEHVVSYAVSSGPPFASACGFGPAPCVAVLAAIEPGGRPAVARSGVFVNDPVTGQPNAFPIAADDVADVYDVFEVTVFPLQNDVDPEGHELRVVDIVQPPTAGEATFNPGGSTIFYAPFAPLAGPDVLFYRVEDSAGASVVAKVTIVPRQIQLALSKSRIDLGVVPVGRMAAGRASLRGGPQGLSGSFRIEAIDPSEFPALLQGTGHDPNDAVSDPQAFSGYLGWGTTVDDLGPVGVPIIYFRPSANVGQVSLARVYLDAPISTGTVSTSVVVIGASGDPAAIPPPRAGDDAASTPVGVPIDIPVLANDTGTSGRGLYISQNGGCPEAVFDGTGCTGGGGSVGVVLSPITGFWEQLRFFPAPGFSGQGSVYYSMSEVDACVNPRQPGCQYEGNMYFAKVTITVQGGGVPLTVTRAGTGSGTVTSTSPAGVINCGTTCSTDLAPGTTVTLTATPAPGSIFTNWSGACSGTGTCTVTVTAATTVTATFMPPTGDTTYPMTIWPVPQGGRVVGAGINCGDGGAQCTYPMPKGAGVDFNAIASPGFAFGGWTGDCTGETATTVRVSFTYPRSCGVVFRSMAAVRTDVDGDGRSDILWRHATQGDVWLWPMQGTTRASEDYVQTVADTNFEIRGQGDFDGDRKADIIWRNTLDGRIYLWPMNGPARLGELYVSTVGTAYDIAGVGDFNGDAKADLLWRNTANGEAWIWLMNGATRLSESYVGTIGLEYIVKGVGDLDGDGKADIVWHGATTGEVWVWLMDGAVKKAPEAWVDNVTGYQIAAVADLTGDGKADIVWHHPASGEVWVWPMNGTTRVSIDYVDTVLDTRYRVAGAGDFNGDGKADLVWHHASFGEVWIWLMNGSARQSLTWIASVPDTGYRIVR